jgi:hypothetical protein
MVQRPPVPPPLAYEIGWQDRNDKTHERDGKTTATHIETLDFLPPSEFSAGTGGFCITSSVAWAARDRHRNRVRIDPAQTAVLPLAFDRVR